jgi:DNA (cytosine-5)-methyltransferase 1
MIQFLYVDLFCGAGGTSTGIHAAEIDGNPVAQVVAAVNHDPIAIESHATNHPETIHFNEDIRTLDMYFLHQHVEVEKLRYPKAKLVLWASLECTNFSIAKGGQARDADSRTLAEHLYRYIEVLKPDIIQIENVMEFRSWGKLDDKGKPLSRDNGNDYQNWIGKIKSYGYNYEWKALNSADFGAYTSRNRFFAQFVRIGLPIAWPKPSYSKKGTSFGTLQDWKPVKEVLDLDVKGNSIFNRKKGLSPKTLARIYAGLEKFVGSKAKEPRFLTSYYSGGDAGRCRDLAIPSPVISTQGRLALVEPVFIAKYFSGRPEGKVVSVDSPCGTITTTDHHSIISLMKYYGNGENVQSIDVPSPTVTTVDKLAMVTHDFLLNPSWGGHCTDIEQPCPVVVASQHKAPLYVAKAEGGSFNRAIEPGDCAEMVKIKQFCNDYGVYDIYMRMLSVDELKRIQGFPADYVLLGTQKDQKKFLGNAVIPSVSKAMVEAMALSYNY